MPDNSVFAKRSEAQWRNIIFPVVSRDVKFGYQAARYPILYRTEVAENLLVHARVFTYHIPFTDGMSGAPYDNFFTRMFPKFYASFHNNRSVGALNDPVYGAVTALPGDWNESADANVDRYGVKLSVSFLEYVDPNSLEADAKTALVGTAASQATSLDTALTKVKSTSLPKLPTTSFAEMIGQIQGYGDKLIRAGNKAVAQLHDIASHCESLVATFDKIKNPQTFEARAAAQRLHKSVVEIAKRSADPAKDVEDIVNQSYTTTMALAQDAQMSIADFLAANPQLANVTRVPPGAKFRRFKRSAATSR